MNEPEANQPPRKYVWPWIFWGMALLFIALAVLWVWLAATKIQSQRDVNTPLPQSAPVR
jgi:hypothetical protein